MLTKEEKEILSQIACDNETGNHLLGRRRSDEYWLMRDELVMIRQGILPTERSIELQEYLRQCTDYDYYHSLPQEKRMF